MEELIAAEKLIIYYAMNLYLLHEDDNAIHLIENLALKIKSSNIYEANIYRILGLIHLHKVNVKEALKNFKLANNLYKAAGSIYG